jgi:nucleoside-diphosphate-sugar epimerase
MASQTLTFRRADLGDEASLANAFEGCEAVVANAALAVKKGASLAAFQAANVTGVENTFRAAKQAGVKRVLLISTVGVYRVKMGIQMDESTPVRDRFRVDASLLTTNWRYTLTKAQGELRARELAEDLGLGLTVFRPGPIYGSRDPKFTEKLLQRARKRWSLLPNVRIPMVHAGDIASGVVTALSGPLSVGRTYNFGGPSQPLPEVIRTAADLLGTDCRVVSVPLGFGVEFDDGAAMRDLGLQHRTLREGLSECLVPVQ